VESFVGKMTQLEVWEKELLESEVQTLFTSCLPVYIEKSLSRWPRLLLNMRGNTTVSVIHGIQFDGFASGTINI